MALPTLEQVKARWHGRRLRRLKKHLVDLACREYGARSIADLGGIWRVNGLYTFHALDNHQLQRAVLVDTDLSSEVHARAREYAPLELISGNFGETEVVNRVRPVDAVMLFDVLLHQVRPDWDDVLRLYGAFAKQLVICNPQWQGDNTVRLLDLGRERYMENVPHTHFLTSVIDRLDETNPQHGRPNRDIHNIWQWGITDDDLIAKCAELGFELVYDDDAGGFPGLSNYRDRGFVFAR